MSSALTEVAIAIVTGTGLAGLVTTAIHRRPAAPPAPIATPQPSAQPENTMSIFAELEDDAVELLKSAGKDIKTFVLNEGQKLVAQAKQTYLGTLALNLVQVMQGQSMTGAEKMEAVIAAITPAITKFVAGGGLPGLMTSVESFAIEFAQSVYNDFVSALAKVSASGATAITSGVAWPSTPSAPVPLASG